MKTKFLSYLLFFLLAYPGIDTAFSSPQELVLFGDSMTRAVLADHSLGDPMNGPQTWHMLRTIWNKARSGYLPEDEGILNYMLMTRNEFLARDELGAVQGTESYSIRHRLEGDSWDKIIVSNFAQLGGSYRVGELQLALYARSLRSTGREPARMIIVDLGRSDFTITASFDEFRRDVDEFYERLMKMSPGSRIVVLRIPDIPSILHRADRTASELFNLLPLRCGTLFRQGRIAVKTGLLPGRPAPEVYASQKERLDSFNQYLEQKVSALRSQGLSIELVSGVLPRENPEDWDQILANDCLHLNRNGHQEEANLLWPTVRRLWQGPASAPVVDEASPPPPHPSDEALGTWTRYVDTLNLTPLQTSCMPRMFPYRNSYRGVVLLFHGFSACPQQFFELSERLSAEGYTVLLPLLPGHGRAPSGQSLSWQDNFPELPTGRIQDKQGYEQYFRFVEEMNTIVAQFPGEKIVGGLSLGGALASYATVQAPYLWTRQLLLSPLYELDPRTLRIGLGTLTNLNNLNHGLGRFLDPFLNRFHGWGQGCEDERNPDYVARFGRSETRAGICQFQLTHILASNQVGFDVWNLIQPTQIATQVVLVEEDPLLHKQTVFHSVGRMRGEKLLRPPYTSEARLDDDPFVRLCYIPSSEQICISNRNKKLEDQDRPCVNHSLLSRFDAPFQNKYWIEPLTEKIVAFVRHGQFFATEAERYQNDPLCAGF